MVLVRLNRLAGCECHMWGQGSKELARPSAVLHQACNFDFCVLTCDMNVRALVAAAAIRAAYRAWHSGPGKMLVMTPCNLVSAMVSSG